MLMSPMMKIRGIATSNQGGWGLARFVGTMNYSIGGHIRKYIQHIEPLSVIMQYSTRIFSQTLVLQCFILGL